MDRDHYYDPDFPRAAYSICQDSEELRNYQLLWWRTDELYDKEVKLMDNFNPF